MWKSPADIDLIWRKTINMFSRGIIDILGHVSSIAVKKLKEERESGHGWSCGDVSRDVTWRHMSTILEMFSRRFDDVVKIP